MTSRRDAEETVARQSSGIPMTDARLQTLIDEAFEHRTKITPQTTGDVRDAVEAALDLLDRGRARVAEKIPARQARIPGKSISG